MLRLPVIIAICLLLPASAGAEDWKKDMFDDPFFHARDGHRDSTRVKPLKTRGTVDEQFPLATYDSRDTSTVGCLQGVMNTGLGVNTSGYVLETASYDWKQHTVGFYGGSGGGTWGGAGAWASVFFTHAGYAQVVNRTLSYGIGLQLVWRTAVVQLVSYTPYGTIRAGGGAESFGVGPHAWIEVGQPLGIASRIQIGPAGVGLTLHWRYWIPRDHSSR